MHQTVMRASGWARPEAGQCVGPAHIQRQHVFGKLAEIGKPRGSEQRRDQRGRITHADEKFGLGRREQIAQKLCTPFDHRPDPVRLHDQPVDADETGIRQDQAAHVLLVHDAVEQLHLHFPPRRSVFKIAYRVAQECAVAPGRRHHGAFGRQARAILQERFDDQIVIGAGRAEMEDDLHGCDEGPAVTFKSGYRSITGCAIPCPKGPRKHRPFAAKWPVRAGPKPVSESMHSRSRILRGAKMQ